MNNQKNSCHLALATLTLSIFSGCAGVQYESMSSGNIQSDPSSPPRWAFSFNFKTSDILISQQGLDASKTPSDPIPCTPATTTTCFKEKIVIAPSPNLDPAVYFAKPISSKPSWVGTLLTPKYDTTNTVHPTSLVSVSFNYNNQIPAIVGAAGAGAAAGFAFGPMGAVVGGVVAGAAAAAHPDNTNPGATPSSPICPDSVESYNDASHQHATPTGLRLPVTVPYESFKPASLVCWHRLPYDENAGWFYKIDMTPAPNGTDLAQRGIPPVLYQNGLQLLLSVDNPYNQSTFPFMSRTDFFDPQKNKDTQDEFPVSACVSVNLQLAWWSNINIKKGNP